eukprot:ANDGO_05163.mRNA.1 Mitogen-activated protein kinase kinase 2
MNLPPLSINTPYLPPVTASAASETQSSNVNSTQSIQQRSEISEEHDVMSAHPLDAHVFSFTPSQFTPIKELGTGAFSTVVLARHEPTGRMVALKRVRLVTEELNSSMIRELDAFAKVSANSQTQSSDPIQMSCIVDYYGYYVLDGDLFLVLEYMNAGSVASIAQEHFRRAGRGCSSAVVSAIAFQMLRGLSQLHDLKIIHRDIKPSNVLVSTDGHVKYADFNTSRVLRNSMDNAFSFTGSALYMSPERLMGHGHSLASDLWSVGVALWELAAGKNPFVSNSQEEGQSFWTLVAAISEQPVPSLLSVFPSISPALSDLVSTLLQRDPALRSQASVLLHSSVMQEVAPHALHIIRKWVAGEEM